MTTPSAHAGRQRQMRGRRSPRNLLAAYDQSNNLAAKIILGNLKKHTDFQISWARAFRQRQAQEGREACGRQTGG